MQQMQKWLQPNTQALSHLQSKRESARQANHYPIATIQTHCDDMFDPHHLSLMLTQSIGLHILTFRHQPLCLSRYAFIT
jgi:hypothetical protein